MIIQVKKKHVNPENIRNYVLFVLVEHRGFEPLTSTLPVQRLAFSILLKNTEYNAISTLFMFLLVELCCFL